MEKHDFDWYSFLLGVAVANVIYAILFKIFG